MLLYLLGDSKEALLSLDAQTKSKKFDIDVGYARLLQAQLLFEENMDLSRQIAEDLTYRAQESSLYLLEYHATVLEGLALQRQGKDYMAWINFVKARHSGKPSQESADRRPCARADACRSEVDPRRIV